MQGVSILTLMHTSRMQNTDALLIPVSSSTPQLFVPLTKRFLFTTEKNCLLLPSLPLSLSPLIQITMSLMDIVPLLGLIQSHTPLMMIGLLMTLLSFMSFLLLLLLLLPTRIKNIIQKSIHPAMKIQKRKKYVHRSQLQSMKAKQNTKHLAHSISWVILSQMFIP